MTASEVACIVPRMRVVHVSPVAVERLSGAGPDDAEMYRMQSAGWKRRGYEVYPIPDDELDHPVNTRCPVCSEDG